MFDSWKSSVISLFNGALDSSAIVLLLFKVRLSRLQTQTTYMRGMNNFFHKYFNSISYIVGL